MSRVKDSIAWNRGKKGMQVYDSVWKQKLSAGIAATAKRELTQEQKDALVKRLAPFQFKKGHTTNCGKSYSQKRKDKIGAAHKGKTSWLKGKDIKDFPKVAASVKKASDTTRGKPNLKRRGSNNNLWKDGRSLDPVYTSWSRNNRNRAKRLAVGSHTYQEWMEVKSLFSSRCPACGRQEPEVKLTEDHIIPLSKGGSNYISNIQPLCGSCNSKKRANIIKYNLVITT